MNRTLEYHIHPLENPLSIKGFLKGKGYSSQNIIQLRKNPDSVLLNGRPAHMNQPLRDKDVLTICIREEVSSEKVLPVKLPLHIVYEDEDLLIVNKPAGMPTHPSLHNYQNSLANALAWYFADQNKPFIFRCVSRLDRDTSGLTIIAKHMVSAGILNSYVAAKSLSIKDARTNSSQAKNSRAAAPLPVVYREYLAIVRGSIYPREGTISAPIGRREGSLLERKIDFDQGEHALTHYRLEQEKNGHSLISLHLETGRTHQIRVHMKYLGFPLIGDYLYNPDMEYISRQALHSYRLRFPHPITGAPMEFTAPLPQDMLQVLEPQLF